jgi:shikimate dehydrogenase
VTPDTLTARTRVFALLGDPVAHSLSPGMHNAAFGAEGLDAVFVALRVAPDDLAGLLGSLARAGGGGNVTLPHKRRAFEAAERALPDARRTGVANTFWLEGGALTVDNTDVTGVRRALDALEPGGIAGAQVLLLGAGGAARAAAVALLDAGAGRVVIRNRTAARAVALAADLDDPRLEAEPERSDGVDAAAIAAPAADLVVNATSLGLDRDDALPLAPEALRASGAGAVLDLVYGADAGGTAWVKAANAAGLAALDGREMLLQQGARAFEHWWRRPAPLDVMRAALANMHVEAHVG